jgi:transposase
VDAAVLAQCGRDLRPACWPPPPAEVQQRQRLLRQRDDLVARRVQTTNRRHALAQWPDLPADLADPLRAVLATRAEQTAQLEGRIQARAAAIGARAADVQRRDAVKGVGWLTATLVLAAPWVPGPPAPPPQAAAHAGLAPAPRQSGPAVRGTGGISKAGSARPRPALSMAARRASPHHPTLAPFYQRLLGRGKLKQVALVAVARKLLVLLVALARHQRTFDPAWQARRARPPAP